jgi:uncharacterized repeat protein (TIGR03803 family)
LALSGSTLYGTTRYGGDNNIGVLFSMNTSGSGYTLLHEFAGGTTDGSQPFSAPVVSGSTLYGTASYGGGTSNYGAVYKYDTLTSSFSLVHSFAGGANGYRPYGSLTLSGNTLYGMTNGGGANGLGAVYKVGTDGTGFQVLHSFDSTTEGYWPEGSLVLSGSTLYGMTPSGGTGGVGTVFKVDTATGNLTVLHSFAGGTTDGSRPYGSLTLSGSTLYGMTYNGGADDLGVVFSMNTSGGNFGLLHSFAGGTTDGSNPTRDLTLDGATGTLYSMTKNGGTNGQGVIFRLGTDGNNFALLHEFAGYSSDGSYPENSLTLSGSTLYGMTNQGGQYGSPNGYGVVFSTPAAPVTPIPEAPTGLLLGVGLAALWPILRRRRREAKG